MAEDIGPRRRCYHAIANVASRGLATYYRQHPDRFDDHRSKEAQERSMEGIKAILKILDEYEITDKPKQP